MRTRIGLYLYFITLTVTVVSICTFIGDTREYEATIASTQKSYEFLETNDEVRLAVADAERSQRGFLLTHDEIYLGPFNGAEARIKDALEKMTELADNQREQQERISRVGRICEAKMAEMAETVRLGKAGRWDDAICLVNTHEGRVLMRECRQVTSEIDQDASARLKTQQGLALASAQRGVANLIGCCLTVALLFAVAVGILALERKTVPKKSELFNFPRRLP